MGAGGRADGQTGSGAAGQERHTDRHVMPSGARDRVANALGHPCPVIEPHTHVQPDPSLRSA